MNIKKEIGYHQTIKPLPKLNIFVYLFSSFVFAALLYGRILSLPFFFDDLVHLPFVDNYSFLEHWLGSNEAPYYRPLTFQLWKLFSVFTGSHNAFLHHATNFVFHVANGWLLSLICWRISSNQQARVGSIGKVFLPNTFAFLVLFLYLFFPFHHQAIPWPGALSHVFVTTLILGGLLAYINQRIVIALILTFVAPFAHENGVVLPALIFLFELVDFLGFERNWRRLMLRPIVMSVPIGLWLCVRTLVSTSRESQSFLPGFESIWQSGTWFFQGLAWPSTIFGRFLLDLPSVNESINDISIVWLTGAVGILIAIAICYRSKVCLTYLLIGSGWWLVASAPAMIVLPFGYIVNSPRLLSLAGCGIAIFWATLLVELIDWLLNHQTGYKIVAFATLLVLAIAQFLAVSQINEANRFHLMLGNVYKQAAMISENLDNQHTYPVFVNFPSSAAPSQKTFVLGNEGVVFWPGYAPQHTIVTINGNINQIDQQFVQVDAIRSDQPYLYGIVRPTESLDAFQHDPNAVFYNTVYAADSITLFPAGNWDGPDLQSSALGTFTPDSNLFNIELLTTGFGQTYINGKSYHSVRFQWRSELGNADQITVFVHAINGAGELVAQADGDPIVGLAPLSLLQIGESMTDIRSIPADSSISAFRVGLYNRVTGERIPFYDSAGQRAANDMYILEIP